MTVLAEPLTNAARDEAKTARPELRLLRSTETWWDPA